MGWQEFMEAERKDLRERREGRLLKALGMALPEESAEQLSQVAKQDRQRAEQGLVAVMGEGGTISYERLDDLSRHGMRARTAAEWVQVEWLKKRVERRKRGESAPPIPAHLL